MYITDIEYYKTFILNWDFYLLAYFIKQIRIMVVIKSINMFCFYLPLVNLYKVHLMAFKQSMQTVL